MIASPPGRPEPEGSRWMTTVLPALSSLGIVGFALVSGSVLYVLLGIGLSLIGVVAVVAARVSGTRSHRRRQEATRRRYAAHLDERHAHLVELSVAQRRAAKVVHPDPAGWREQLSGDRLWERRPRDPDFLSVRLGRGRAPLAVPVRLDAASPAADEEPDLRHEAEMLLALHVAVDDIPIAISLADRGSLVVQGPEVERRPLLRAVVAGLALTHAPGELQLLGLLDERESDWLALLPHVSGTASDLPHLRALIAGTRADAVVVVADTAAVDDAAALMALFEHTTPEVRWLLGMAPEDTAPAGAAAHALLDADDGLQVRFADGAAPRYVARPDVLPHSEARAAAKALSGVAGSGAASPATGPVRLSSLLAASSSVPALSVPLGRDPLGEVVGLDLAEAAAGGQGPHGLLVGATGSGKSELLRSVLAALIARRSPRELAIVCWDFKGGAAMAPFAGVPHLRATVTNLDSDPRLIDRAARSLRAELRRRQQFLADAGVDSAAALTARGSQLPTLLLVVDEFSELLSTHPDLLDLFVATARLGRSLGIHLLLSSQRFDEGRLRGLESHLRYRICLRTFSAADSQTVLGSDAAWRLPPTPGAGLLAVDGRLRRFDGALADDLADIAAAARTRWADCAIAEPVLWQPDLPDALGLTRPRDASGPRLTATVGLVDLPDKQVQEPLVLDLAGGHAAIVGAASSGRTTALATVIVALAAANRSEWLEMHVVTEDRDSFALLADLPHVRSVLRPDDEDAVRHLLGTLALRLRGGGASAERRVLLVIDGWARFGQAGEVRTDLLAELAAAGPRVGIHLVLTGSGWSEFRSGLREHLGTRLELRLADPFESEHGRHRAASLPALPGRLLTATGDEAQLALPLFDATGAGAEVLLDGQRSAVAEIRARGDAELPRVRPLPDRILLEHLRPHARAAVLGPDADGAPQVLDLLGPDHHLLVIGETGSGRTTALSTLLQQLSALPLDLWVIDPRRTLLTAGAGHLAGADSRCAEMPYAYSPSGVAELVADLARRLQSRRPAEGRARRDLLAAHGSEDPAPRSVLIIDDYDLLLANGLTGSLGQLTELLPFADEIGLSVVAARGTTGRLGYDPSWQALTDAPATGLLLSGDASAGPLLYGVRASRRPPGRGLVVRRGVQPTVIQVAMTRPREGASTAPAPSAGPAPPHRLTVVGQGAPWGEVVGRTVTDLKGPEV